MQLPIYVVEWKRIASVDKVRLYRIWVPVLGLPNFLKVLCLIYKQLGLIIASFFSELLKWGKVYVCYPDLRRDFGSKLCGLQIQVALMLFDSLGKMFDLH
ncbi:unnamed protein product [Ilex paraguariensis]|uniref:Uncharacterized protein n=1 Tax=Ilex paraguariensis TaxID=185542 RepID=A0ABC8TMF3_9AQUA